MTTKTIVFVGGPMAERYPDGIKIAGETAYECMSGLRNWPGFVPGMDKPVQVTLPDYQSRDALLDRIREGVDRILVEELAEDNEMLAGAGGKLGGILQIVIGVVLVVFAPQIAGLLAGTMFATTAGSIAMAGALIALGGIRSLLTPTPNSSRDSGQETKSLYIPSTGNTVRAGTRIPLLLGRHKAYGHFLSFQVTASNLGDSVKPPDNPVPGGRTLFGKGDFQMQTKEWE